MKNKVEELIEIIKKGVEIASMQDDEQFINNAIIQANIVAENFSKNDWESLIAKLPVEKTRSRDYDKIKKQSLRSIIENEDNAITSMVNNSILDIIIKSAPNDAKSLAIEKIQNKKHD